MYSPVIAASYTRSQSFTNAQLRPKKTKTKPTYSTSAMKHLLALMTLRRFMLSRLSKVWRQLRPVK
jgi:hypothetical protein